MIKKLFFTLLTFAALFFSGCNNSSEKAKEKDNDKIENEDKRVENKTNSQTREFTNDDDDKKPSENDITKIADAYCDCVNKSLTDIDPLIKKIFTGLAASNNPKHFFEYELEKLNEDEGKEFKSGLKKLGEHKEIAICKGNQKYSSKDEENEMRKEIFEILKDEEECQLVAGFLRMKIIILAEEEKKKKTKDD